MTVLADTRPPAVDLLLRPATTVTVTLNWPTSSLAGRTFTSTLDGDPLALTIDGDVMTVEASDTLTGALPLGVPVAWLLLEDIDSTPEPIAIGTWTPDDGPRATTSTSLPVTVGGAQVDVTVNSAQASIAALDARLDTAEAEIDALQEADTGLDTRLDAAEADITSLQAMDTALDARLDSAEGEIDALQATDVTLDGRLDNAEANITGLQGALTTHEARRTIDGAQGGVHGVIEHRWEVDGWAPFQRKVVTQDGAQALALTVSGDHGVFTGPAAGLGNQRELFLHEDTLGWTAGEITALIARPSTYVDTNRPQSGLVVGYELIGGFHTALVVWYDVFVGDPSITNIGGWRGNGANTIGLAAGGQYTAQITRDLRILQVRRFQFINWIDEYVVQPYHLHGLVIGDVVDIDATDSTFDEANIAVAGADPNRGTFQVIDPTHTGAVAIKVDDGVVSHDAGHKRWFPYWLKARRVGAGLAVKAWRTTEPEPADWQATVTVAPNGSEYPQLPTGGGFGVIGAHAHSGSSGRYGPLTIRRL